MTNPIEVSQVGSGGGSIAKILKKCGPVLAFVFWRVLGSEATVAFGQTYLQNVGVPPFTTAVPAEDGFVNVANGNLHLEIPLGTLPERGGRQDKIAILYHSAIWVPNWSSSWGLTWLGNYWFSASLGWRLSTSNVSDTHWSPAYGACSTINQYWIYYDPKMTQHAFKVWTEQASPSCPGWNDRPSDSGYAVDGSGYYIAISNYSCYQVRAPNGDIVNRALCVDYYTDTKDVNGNAFITTGVTTTSTVDPVGRIPVVDTTASDGTSDTITITNAEGNTSSQYIFN